MPAQALSRSIDTGINHDPTQSVRTMPTRPPEDLPLSREICRAKLQAGSRRPAERIRPKGEREVAAGMVLRMLMQRERHSVQDFPPGYIIDHPAAD